MILKRNFTTLFRQCTSLYVTFKFCISALPCYVSWKISRDSCVTYELESCFKMPTFLPNLFRPQSENNKTVVDD